MTHPQNDIMIRSITGAGELDLFCLLGGESAVYPDRRAGDIAAAVAGQVGDGRGDVRLSRGCRLSLALPCLRGQSCQAPAVWKDRVTTPV